MKTKHLIALLLTLASAVTIFNAQTVSAAVQAKWINKGEIEANGSRFIDGKPDDSDRSYFKDGKDSQIGSCNSAPVIRDINSDNTTARLYQQKVDPSTRINCVLDTSRVEEVTFEASSIANSSITGGASSVSGGANSDDPNSCERKGSSLAWIFCPIIKLLDATMNLVDTQIQAILDVDETSYINDDIKKSWATIRNIAYIILIPITLVMVIGTAIGSSMVDAYTVKKAMPRLAIAVIFIALSYEICVFLISLFNTLGYGTIGLLTAPFGDNIATLSLADLFGNSRGGVGGGALAAILLLPKVALAGIAILLLLWFFGTTFLLFAGAAFLILTLRQLFIVGLLLIAPLAILVWIFPGNDKLWKSWWGTFSKLLIMFPLIMGIIAVGRIFAVIADADRGGGVEGSIITPFVKLAAYMLPYAFIPFTFKFAGGIFANIAGVVNDKEKGLFDRQKRTRAAKKERLFAGGLEEKTLVGKLGNQIGRRAGAGWKGRYGFGQRGKSAMDIRARALQAETMKDTRMQQFGFNDDGILALGLGAGSATTAQRRMESLYKNDDGSWQQGWSQERVKKAVESAKAMGFTKQNSMAALETAARNKFFSLPEGAKGMETLLETADDIAGVTRTRDQNGNVISTSGNTTLSENIMGGLEYHARNAGRFDVGHHDYKNWKADYDAAWSKAVLSQHAQGTGASMQAFIDYTVEQFNNGSEVDKKNAAIRILEMQNALPYATADNQKRVNKMMSEKIQISFEPQTRLVPDTSPGAPPGAMKQETRTFSVEEQLAAKLQAQRIQVSASGLRGQARVYDQQDPYLRSQQGEVPAGGGGAPEG